MIIKVTPDKERVKSMITLIENRIDFVKTINESSFSTIAAEHYYEIIKELTAILVISYWSLVLGFWLLVAAFHSAY